MSFMPVEPGKDPRQHMQLDPNNREGLYGTAKSQVPDHFRDLLIHIFGKRIDHYPGAEYGQKAMLPKSKLGKAVVKKVYGSTNALESKYPLISKIK